MNTVLRQAQDEREVSALFYVVVTNNFSVVYLLHVF